MSRDVWMESARTKGERQVILLARTRAWRELTAHLSEDRENFLLDYPDAAFPLEILIDRLIGLLAAFRERSRLSNSGVFAIDEFEDELADQSSTLSTVGTVVLCMAAELFARAIVAHQDGGGHAANPHLGLGRWRDFSARAPDEGTAPPV